MKKVFLAVLAIAAMMVSCKKDGPVGNQVEGPEVEVNEPQPVILGSNLFKAPTTKASVDNIGGWREDMKNGEDIDKFIYVWALKQDKTPYIENVSATLAEETEQTPDEENFGTLTITDPENNSPFYYEASSENDILYDFYGYYLGYALDEPEASVTDGVITVENVQVKGNNDIMIADTDKAADAVVEAGMVNPKYLYSEYSARQGVKPNLVFKHQLSKFTFNVRYAGEIGDGDVIELTGITFMDVYNSGNLTLNKVAEDGREPGFAHNETKGNIVMEGVSESSPIQLDNEDYDEVGEIMVVPFETETCKLKIDLKQTFAQEGVVPREYNFEPEISYEKVKPDVEGSTVTAIEAGKQYKVYITVYGSQEVVVNVQLVPWEYVGDITIDPNDKADGIMKQVSATFGEGENAPTCTLYAEDFVINEENPIRCYCKFDGEGEQLVVAPAGTYTVTGTDGDLVVGTTITVEEEGKIANVVAPEQGI